MSAAKMWKTELKALVFERLKAAAEEIFSLFERTMREYEKEVLRSKQEEQRKLEEEMQTDRRAPVQLPVPNADVLSEQEHHGKSRMEQWEENQELQHIKEEQEVELWAFHTSVNQEEVETKDSVFNIITLESNKDERHSPLLVQKIEGKASDCLAGCSSFNVQQDCGASELYNDCQMSEGREDECSNSGGQESSFNMKKSQCDGATSERPHTCSVCNKRFRLKSILTQHMKMHTGDKPYTCGVCGKSFIQRSYLKTHMNAHAEQKPHTCSFCGRGFTQVGNMNAHIRIHTGEKPHRCNECGKGFRGKAGLMKHTVVHTGERPFACTVCDMKFSAQSNLIRHMKSHSGERPHCCNLCGKKFIRRNHLTIHSRTHKGKAL